MAEEESNVKSGLTWRSFLALIYIIVVFQPANIWLFLMTGSVTLYVSVQWATLLLFVGLGNLSRRPLTKQEATLIYLGAWLSGQFGLFLSGIPANGGWVYQAWFKNSPITSFFNLEEKIPHFYAPVSLEPWVTRTFFSPQWIPIMIASLSFIATAGATDIALGLFASQMYIQVEKLPFPTAQPVAEAVVSMTETRRDRIRVMSIFTVVGLAYGALAYAAPLILQAWGLPFSPIPIPWADLNKYLHHLIPGISLGIGTDLIILASGFIIPFHVCLAVFISSFALYSIGNMILVAQKATVFGQTWTAGMSIADSWQRSLMFAWAGPLIGIAIATGIMPLVRRPQMVTGLGRTLMGKSKAGLKIPLYIMLTPWLIGMIGLSVVDYIFAPDMPIWFFLLINVFWSFSFIIINGRAAGVAMPIQIPYFREVSVIASGYTGYNAWFVPMHVTPGDWVSMYKICDLTETHHLSFAKAMALVWPIAILFGFLYTQDFWRIAPIPSASYPGANIYWPATGTLQALFISRPEGIFQPLWIVYGFIVSAAVYIALDFILPAMASALITGISVGSFTPIPTALLILVGAIIGKILSRAIGQDQWNKYRAISAAGISLGEGLVVVIGTAISLVIKSLWILPY